MRSLGASPLQNDVGAISLIFFGMLAGSEGGKIPAKLQKADVPVVKHTTCKEYYKSVNDVKEETMICAGPEEGGRSVCQVRALANAGEVLLAAGQCSLRIFQYKF